MTIFIDARIASAGFALLCLAACSKKSDSDSDQPLAGSTAAGIGAAGMSAGSGGTLASAGSGGSAGMAGSTVMTAGSGGSIAAGSGGAAGSMMIDDAGATDGGDQPMPTDGCTRESLSAAVDAYVAALEANDPSGLTLADDVKFTENGETLEVGAGFWETAGATSFKRSALDTETCQSVTEAVTDEDGTDIVLGLRLKHEGGAITEIETMVVRGRAEAMLFDLTRLDKPSAAFTTPPPRDQRNTRAEMIDIAMRYPAGLRVGSFVTSDVPFSADAYRLENGQYMGGPGCTFIAGCDDIRNQRLPVLAGITGGVVAVDEENGTVLLRLDFGPGSVMGGGRGARGAAPAGGAPAPEMVLVTFEAFKIYGGQVHAVEAVFESMPVNTPRGWE